MNKLLAFFLCISFCTCNCQMYDNHWIFGGPTNVVLNFETGVIDSIPESKSSGFWNASSTISNKEGELLLYSNGVTVKNKYGDTIQGGDSFTFGRFDTIYYFPGELYLQGVLLLPMPGSDSLLYYFHTASVDSVYYQANRLFYSIIDITAANGLGAVMSQNNVLLDTFVTDAGMGLCKHANGKDWWLIKPKHKSNTYFRFLIKSNGVIEGPWLQSIGVVMNDPDWKSQIVFNVNGDKMARAGTLQKGQLFEFDRCTGLLSSPKDFFDVGQGYVWGGGGAFLFT